MEVHRNCQNFKNSWKKGQKGGKFVREGVHSFVTILYREQNWLCHTFGNIWKISRITNSGISDLDATNQADKQ